MRKFLTTSAMLLALGATTGVARAEFNLTILHINDFHARFEPINKYDSNCSEEDAAEKSCFGGAARLKAAIEQRREALDNSNVVLLSAGDEFQGSLYYSTYKSEVIADFMNDIGFDAVAVGNHEFDDGPEELAAFIERAEFPIIGGNFDVAAEPALAGKLDDTIILDIVGEKVAVIGALTVDTAEISSPGDKVSFTPAVDYAKEKVAELEGEGIDKIILLSHLGFGEDKRVAAQVPGIDVVVGGHTNTLLSNEAEDAVGPYPVMVENSAGEEVPVVQAYAYGKYLGELNVTWDDDGNIVSAEGEPILLDASIEQDPETLEWLAELRKPIEETIAEVIGNATGEIVGSRDVCRAEECSMGNLVADAMLDRAKGQGVTIAITNGGGLRASIDEGDITMGEVLTVLPFSNTMATFELKGADLLSALEKGVSQIEEGGGRFPQVAGLKFSFDVSRPVGERISDVMVEENGEWVPLDPEKTYGVVTNNYMRTGGDGYKIFAEKGMNAYDGGPGLEQVVADYIADLGGDYDPYTDGRITRVE